MSWNEQSRQAGGGQVNSQGNNQNQSRHPIQQKHLQKYPWQQRGYPQRNQSFSLDLQNKYQVLIDQNGDVFYLD